MAHYAFIDENNYVVQVIVGRDENDTTNGITDWETYYQGVYGLRCVRTSYNTIGGIHYTGIFDDNEQLIPSADQSKAFRKNYAGIGFTYDEARDAFIPPKPFESWVLLEESCLWSAPVLMPEDGAAYYWDEDAGNWAEITDETQ